MIGLGRMGSNMVQRLLRAGHQCVAYDVHPEAAQALVKDGAVSATTIEDFATKLKTPRAIWMMVPAAVVDETLKHSSRTLKKMMWLSMVETRTTTMTFAGQSN